MKRLDHAWREHPITIDALGAWTRAAVTVTEAGDALRAVAAPVTPSLFASVIPTRPVLGSLLDERDVASGEAVNGVLVSFRFFRERLGSNEDAIGRVIRINGRPHRIVGVMPSGFVFPDRDVQLWPALGVVPVASPEGARVMIVNALARLRPDATAAQAAVEGTARGQSAPDIGTAALALFGSTGAVTLTAAPALEVAVGEVRAVLLILLAVVGLLLVTATASVVSVQLARAARRRNEIAIRSALGATAARVTRQWIVESSIVAAAGGACGFALTLAFDRAIPALVPADFPRLDDIAVDWRVAMFAAGVATIVAIVTALFASFVSAQTDPLTALHRGERTSVAGSDRSAVHMRLAITGAQIAVACVLLVGAGLLARSFVSLLRVDRGYDAAQLATAGLVFPREMAPARRVVILEQLQQRLQGVPVIRHAAFGLGMVFGRRIPSPLDPATTTEIEGYLHTVSADYLSAVGARLLAGRLLTNNDSASAPPAVVVDRSFATRYLGAHPVGALLRLNLYDRPLWQVVGIVDDMEGGGVGVSADPFGRTSVPRLYLSYRQSTLALPAIVMAIRFDGDAHPISAALRRALREQDAALAFDSIITMDQQIMTTLGRPRAYALIVGAVAFFAVAISGVGLFGVLSYATSQRTREIGIRTALGATPPAVVKLVVRETVVVCAGGLLVGLVTAYVLAESLSKLLYGVTPHDPLSFVAVPTVLIGVAVMACSVPARRAAHLEPISALRSE